VPDQSVFASAGRADGDVLHLAARHQGGQWAMLYLADRAIFQSSSLPLAPVCVLGRDLGQHKVAQLLA